MSRSLPFAKRTYKHKLFAPRKVIKDLVYVQVPPLNKWLPYARKKIPNNYWQRHSIKPPVKEFNVVMANPADIPVWCKKITIHEGKLVDFFTIGDDITIETKQHFVEKCLEMFKGKGAHFSYEVPRPGSNFIVPGWVLSFTVRGGNIVDVQPVIGAIIEMEAGSKFKRELNAWISTYDIQDYKHNLIPMWVEKVVVTDGKVVTLNIKPISDVSVKESRLKTFLSHMLKYHTFSYTRV